jgi:acid phosphatase
VRRARLLRGTLLFLAGALVAAAVALAAGGGLGEIRETSVSDGTPIYGIRPTGVGLPLVGGSGSVGAGDLAPLLKTYHDSGAYERDLALVDWRATRFLQRRVAWLKARWRHCRASAVRSGTKPQHCVWRRPALVLDIDETALSNYAYFGDFKNIVASLAQGAASATTPAIAPTLRLYNAAKAEGVSVFFITGRPTAFQNLTVQNLTRAGYSGWSGLVLSPGGDLTDYKSAARAGIEQQGYRIVLNVGDQETDLAGGYADRAFKLPNPFYYSP